MHYIDLSQAFDSLDHNRLYGVYEVSTKTGLMANVVDYPVKTSEWSKTLIDTLNPIIDRLEKLILTETERVPQNVNLQFKTLRGCKQTS